MMKSICSILLLLIFVVQTDAQYLTAIQSKWADEFKEWKIFTYDALSEQEGEGELNMKWQFQNDWTEWDFRIFDASGTIRQKFNDDPSTWELQYLNELVTAKTQWRDDFSEWRITDGPTTLKLKSKWKNNINEWQIEDKTNGNFYMFTSWEDDPREWEIDDQLKENISPAVKMMVSFLILFNSSPKI